MECDFSLLFYGLFKIPKIAIILKALLSIYIYIYFLCFIASWFEIGFGKKKLLSISFKYSYFKPIFNYTRK
jgi:hypothetical protein